VTMHRLVQAVARARSEANGLAQDATNRLIARIAAIYPSWSRLETSSWPLCAQLTPHLLVQSDQRRFETTRVVDWADLLDRAGRYFHGRAAYSQAFQLFRDAVRIRETNVGPEHPLTAVSLSNLAFLLQAQGDLTGARPLYERALAIREKALGPEHPETAQTLTWLAVVLMNQENFAEAQRFLERALMIQEKPGRDQRGLSTSLNWLGVLLVRQNDLEKARPILERALAIREKANPEHPVTAITLANLAWLLRLKKDFQGARPLYERA